MLAFRSAYEVLEALRDRGIRVSLNPDGDRVVLEGDAEIDAALVDGVRKHKIDLVRLLSGPRLTDGCGLHGVALEDVAARWATVERSDIEAAVCPCCCGPTLPGVLVCTRCPGVDLDVLRVIPPCSVCGATGYTVTAAGEWRCATCAEGGRV